MTRKQQSPDDARRAAFALYNWLTTAEVAAAIHRSVDYVLRRIHKPDAQGFQWDGTRVVQLGRDYLFDPSEVQRFVDAHRVAAA